MIFNKQKRGINQYIATVLLIGFVVLIILIIMLWGRNIYQERTEKEGALAEKALQCTSVSISVNLVGGNIEVTNTGSVPLDGLVLREEAGVTRLSNIYTTIDIGSSFTLSKSNVGCNVDGSEPTTPGQLCSNVGNLKIFPALQPAGRGAPLVSCTSQVSEVTLG